MMSIERPTPPPIAALYDIHGNLPALDAALAAVDAGATIVVGGDVALGPMPVETIERLMELGPRARFVSGNCDRLMVDAFDGRPLARLPDAVRESVAWAAGRLDRRHRDFLASFSQSLAVTTPIDGGGAAGEVLFCHATPRSDEEIFTVATPAERVRPMLAGVTQAVVVCGHTHMQFDRTVDGVRLLNAGSVGMPFGAPGAYWLLLDAAGVRPMRTAYDLARAAALVRRTSYPGAEEFASRHVLDPPSEADALRLFEPAAAR